MLTGFFWVVALILAYVARTKADTWENSHFSWQIRTIWTGLVLFSLIAVVLIFTREFDHVAGMVVGILSAIGVAV
ncbi:MAG: hypothetical protein JO189_19910 [Deltaproteobacteria bacterium]|nr:hypothetical protein [Deltaproteobacteria bacterium]